MAMRRGFLDLRPVFLVCGLLLAVLSVTMMAPAILDLVLGFADWRDFASASVITFFVGGAMVLTSRFGPFRLSLRQAFVLTVVSWVVLAGFAALPFVFAVGLGASDAFFESMSGLTTTGSTVIQGLDALTPGVLLWRGILQWLGGIGLVVTGVTILPALRVGGMQIFRVEAFDAQERLVPRAASLASGLIAVYTGLTALWAFVLWMVGMGSLDAVIHAMTALSTGGFSTSDLSVALFDDAVIEAVLVSAMIAGSLPFVLYLHLLHGAAGPLFRDTQARAFIGTLSGAILIVFAWQWIANDVSFGHAFRQAAFTTTAMMTGTGYFISDYWRWGGLPVMVLFFLAFMGGCAGSTTSAIKVFRFQILYEAARTQLSKLLQPHGVFVAYYNRRPIPGGVPEAVLAFFFLYAMTFAVASLLLGLFGLDFFTSISAASAALSNVGPGFGLEVGSGTTLAGLPTGAKWVLSFVMLLGRLELFSLLILFLPDFWRA